MPGRWKTAAVLGLLAAVSAWLLNLLAGGGSDGSGRLRHDPDHFMENFTTINMELDGRPKTILRAVHMAHYPDNNTTELVKPRLEVFRPDKTPVQVIAERGWVTADNEVILLSGNVTMWQDDHAGERLFEIVTSDVRILMDQEYAETDKPAVLTGRKTTLKATGVRAYLQESRLELLNEVYGKILQN